MAIPGPHSPSAAIRAVRDLSADPRGALDRLRARYGPVVRIGGPGRLGVVVLFGAEANELILADHPEWFRWGDAMKALIPVDGPTALVVTDGPDHQRRRRLVQPGFHRRRIDSYLGLMVAEADAVIDGLAAGTTYDLYAEFRRAIRRSVVLALFGEQLRSRADEFGAVIQPAFDFVNRPPYRQVRVPVPGSGYLAARRARAAADRLIDDEIARRERTGVTGGDDVLAELLGARDEDGVGLTREEIRDQVVSLIAAGYDTTSAAFAWTMWRVLAESGVRAELRRELGDELLTDELRTDELLTVDAIRRMPYLQGVVQETLRLDPPGVVAPRTAVTDFEIAGYRVPKRSLVVYSPYVTGRDPGSWRDPLVFRPRRWDPAHADFEDPGPYASVAFGGGARRCLGFAFATLELQALTARFVARVDAELIDPEPPAGVGVASVMPRDGVRVRIVAVRAPGTAAPAG